MPYDIFGGSSWLTQKGNPYNMAGDQVGWPEPANQGLYSFLTSPFARKGIHRELSLILDRQGMGTTFPQWISKVFRRFPKVRFWDRSLPGKVSVGESIFILDPQGPETMFSHWFSKGFH